MPNRSSNKKQKGQGLIETVIALLIVSGGVVALIQFEHNLAYSNSISQQQAEATVLATSEIEALRNFGVINNTAGYNSYQSIATGSSVSTGTNASYALNWVVTTSVTTPTYKTVDLTVTWTDSNGVTQTVELTTIITGIDPALQADVI